MPPAPGLTPRAPDRRSPHPLRGERLRVALLTTRRAPGLDRLLAHPARGRDWELSVVVATDPAVHDHAAPDRAGIPLRVHDLARHAAARGVGIRDLGARAAYDRETRRILEPFRPDLILLSGYLHILTDTFLQAYPDRIVNVHDADLCLTGEDGLPRYRGLHSTREAILAGEGETRSTVHLVTREVDTGPPLLRSWTFPVHPLVREALRWRREDILRAYAYAQREWMMEASWGRLLGETVGHFARGELRRLGDRMVVGRRVGPRDLPAPEAGGRGPATRGVESPSGLERGGPIPVRAGAGG